MKQRKSNMPIYESLVTGRVQCHSEWVLQCERRLVGSAVCVDVQGILPSFYAAPDEDFVWKLTDVFPPYSCMWFEWSDVEQGMQMAVSVVAFSDREEIERLLRSPPLQDTQTLLVMGAFGETPSGKYTAMPFHLMEEITADGTCSRDGDMIVHVEDDVRKALDVKAGAEVAQYNANVAKFAISLMNCRNIGHVEHEGVALRKRQGRKPRKWKYTYRTLTIKPMGASKSVASHDGETTDHNAMHFCRGNFATYTEEKPLFGKYVGKFWRPAHLKGKATVGVVDKDYAIADPNESLTPAPQGGKGAA